MKITLSFKTPDVGDEAVKEAKEDLRNAYLAAHGVDEVDELSDLQRDELENKLSACHDEAEAVCERYLRYGECLTVELDTVTQEAVVLRAEY
jgi:hypothetical protein